MPHFIKEDGQQEGPRVVISTIALLEVRNGVGRVLEDACRIGHPFEVFQSPIRQFGLLFSQRSHRQRLVRLVLSAKSRLLERLDIMLGGSFPDHFASQAIGGLAHSESPRAVSQQAANLTRQRRRVGERYDHPEPAGQQFLSVPERRRNDGLAAAE